MVVSFMVAAPFSLGLSSLIRPDRGADLIDRSVRVYSLRRRRQVATAGLPASSTQILVPPCGGLSSVKRPSSASTRSSSPVKPEPSLGSAPPIPSSTIEARSFASLEIATEISEALLGLRDPAQHR
jgi:hypothetical protein